MNIQEFRQQYPNYNDIDDKTLADSLYKKHYSDMDRAKFDQAFLGGVSSTERGVSEQKQDANWYDPIRQFIKGSTFGLSDEIGAGMAAIPAAIATRTSPIDAYKSMQSSVDAEQRAYEAENPAKATALEVAGAIPTGLAAGAKALGGKALQSVPKWLGAMGVGATEGAIYGAGTSQQGERTAGAAKGAAIGGVAAPVGGAVASTAGKVISPIARAFKEHLTYTPNAQAVDVLRKVADDAGLTVDDIVNQYKKLGDDAALVDVDENFRGLMRALSDRSGTAKREARNVLESRQLGSVDRLTAKIEKTIGKKAVEFSDTVKALKAERNVKAKPFYEEAWQAEPSQVMIELSQRPSIKAALTRANRLAADEGEDITGSLFKQFHYAKMALDDQIGKALRSGNNNHARILIKAKNDLLNEMDIASPAYKQGRDLYAGDSELLNAATTGLDLFKMRPDMIDEVVSSMGQSERELFKHGAVKSIIDKLEDSQLTHDNARKLINSKTMQRKLSVLFDSPDELRDFVGQAIREREFSRTRQVVTGGSPTSQNLQMGKNLDDAAGDVAALLGGPKGGAIKAVISALKGKAVTPETIDHAAKILLDNGLTEQQIRQIFTRSGVKLPNTGNAFRGAMAPATLAIQN